MNFFRHLGQTILSRWRLADLDEGAFADIATSALADHPPSAHVDPFEVVRWVHEEPLFVPQASTTTDFGQPPVTVFCCEQFYIDVLFWLDGTTSIHQHAFSGAFHVMHGSSLQSSYRFVPRKRYSERLLVGELSLTNVEYLARGDVRPIFAGAGLVHALFHLDRPSVSVVVRTPSDALAGPQYAYSRAGLAWDPFHKPEGLVRKIQTLELLKELAHPDLETIARASIRDADAFVAFRLLERMGLLLEPMDRFSSFLAELPRHSELGGVVRALVEDKRRNLYITDRRRLAKHAEHRFFLALLLNLPRREPILAMVRHRFPERNPAETVLRWLQELARIDAIHTWVAEAARAPASQKDASILDVELDDAALAVARRLLENPTETPSCSESEASAEASLRSSVLLRPLFLG